MKVSRCQSMRSSAWCPGIWHKCCTSNCMLVRQTHTSPAARSPDLYTGLCCLVWIFLLSWLGNGRQRSLPLLNYRNPMIHFDFTYSAAGVVGAPQMTSQPVSSIFLGYPLPFGTWQTPGPFIPWCCLPISFSPLVFFLLSLCLARWFWPDLMNGRQVHTTAICVSFMMVRRSSCGLIACWILAQTSSLVSWSLYEICSILQ